MSVKKQNLSMCKQYSFHSFHEEIPEEFSDEIEVNSFLNNIFHISQSQQRALHVSKGSNKKSFAFKFFQFCKLKTQQRNILLKEVIIYKKELSSLVGRLRDSLKTSDKAKKCSQNPIPKPKIEIGATKSKNNLFAQNYNDYIEHPKRQTRLSIRFGNNKFFVFSIKQFELYGNQFFLTESLNFNHREIHHLYRNLYHIANKCEMNESNYYV